MSRKARGPSASAVDRRDFVTACAVASAAALVRPPEAEAAQEVPADWKRAPCRLCGVGCGMLVRIQRGRAVAIKGDPESPVSRGLACVKGYYAIQALYGRDRITRAHVRQNGTLAPVGMTAALDVVATRLRDTIRRYGPDSAALYGAAQWTAADALAGARLFRDAIGSRNVDTSARLYTASADAGHAATFGATGPTGTFEDIDHADVFVLWNVNLAETDPVLFSRMLERRRNTPSVRIIDLGTRTTRTSYAADRALLIAPHSEIAVANAICREIATRGQMNRGFLERHVAFKRGAPSIGHGLPGDTLQREEAVDVGLEDYLRSMREVPTARASEASGLGPEDIRWMASLYADPARKVVSVWGTAVNQQSRGTWLNSTLHNVHLLVGKVATPGNAALPVTGQPGGASLVADQLGHSVAAPASATPVARPALSIFQALERGEIRFLWIQATNPMVSLPNLERYRSAARRPDLFVVVSEAYPTPTTDVADVVLPSAMWIERDGVVANVERRLQHVAQLVPPPGDCMSDARQMLEVANRLGHAAAMRGAVDASTAWAEIVRLHPAEAFPPLSALQSSAGVLWPAPGGVETRWRYNAAYDPAADRRHGEFDFYGHPDHRAWIWLHPDEGAPESPDREYPFWLMIGSVVEHWGAGSMTRRIPSLHRAVPHAYVEINRADARALGIRDGDPVRLTSRRGSVEAEARIDYRGQPPRGRVFVPAFDEGVAVNLLTLDASCPLSGQPDYGACAVRLERKR